MDSKEKSVALVTGASAGLGKDFALRLIAEGYVVYGAARRIERMRDIEAAGGVALAMDVTDDIAMMAGVERIIRERGRIDVLINNAGYGQLGAIEDVPIAEGRRQLEVNLVGAARLVQLCLPHMRARRFGKIINISSVGGKLASPLGGWYHASKFALEGFSDALRMEVRRFGIDVIVVEPGAIETEFGTIATGETERHSTEGAYSDWALNFRRSQARLRKSPPRVISDLIVRALRVKRPKTRYHGGNMAGLALFLRRRLSDRQFDIIISAMFR